MSVQQDFDRIALLTEASEDGAAHNDHYHNYLLQHLPANCGEVLEIGCGTGAFSRHLAQHLNATSHRDRNAGSAGILPASGARILALDFSPEMIRIARARSAQFPNIEYELADVCERSFDVEGFDCIATIATLHHLPYAEMLAKMKAALKPGGVLLVVDLFEPAGLMDSLLNLVAIPVSVGLRLMHYGRLLPPREERDAWKAHEQHDRYPTMREVRDVCARVLPGAKIKQHLLWRYSIVWKK
jgi:SAM-dependent methyltransferase